MANQYYTAAIEAEKKGDLDFDTATLKARLVMTNTTCGSENATINFVGDFTTLDTHNAASYVDVTLTGVTVTQSGLVITIDANDPTFAAIEAGLRNIAGILVFAFGTNDADSIPVGYCEYAVSQPHTATGDYVAQFNSGGICKTTAA